MYKKYIVKYSLIFLFMILFSFCKFNKLKDISAMSNNFNQMSLNSDEYITNEIDRAYFWEVKDYKNYFKNHSNGIQKIYMCYHFLSDWYICYNYLNDWYMSCYSFLDNRRIVEKKVEILRSDFEKMIYSIALEYDGLKKGKSQLIIYDSDNNIVDSHDIIKECVDIGNFFEEIEKSEDFKDIYNLLERLTNFKISLQEFLDNKYTLILTQGVDYSYNQDKDI